MSHRARITATFCALTLVVGLAPQASAEVSPDVTVNGAEPETRNHIFPDLVANPDDDEHLVATDVKRIDGNQDGDCMVYVSRNQGGNWTGSPLPVPDGTQCTEMPPPEIAFGADDGEGHVVLVAYYYKRPGNSARHLVVARSTNGGADFGDPVPVPAAPTEILLRAADTGGTGLALRDAGYGIDLAADPETGDVYVTWATRPAWTVGPLWVSHSPDNGGTFEAPTPIVAPVEEAVDHPILGGLLLAPAITIGPDGGVLVTAGWFYTCHRYTDLTNWTHCLWAVRIVFARSDDKGETFSRPQTVEETVAYDTSGGFAAQPEIAVHPTNPQKIYIAFEDSQQGTTNRNVWLARTFDGGRSWLPRVRLSDDPVEPGYPHTRPEVSVAPNGRVDAAWYDGRHDPSSPQPVCPGSAEYCQGRDVYYGYSLDGGLTFTNVRVTDETFEASTRAISGDQVDALGSIGLVSRDDGVTLVWEQSADTVTVGEGEEQQTLTPWDLHATNVLLGS